MDDISECNVCGKLLNNRKDNFITNTNYEIEICICKECAEDIYRLSWIDIKGYTEYSDYMKVH